MLIFAGGFIGMATWLGKQGRTETYPAAAPALNAADARHVAVLGLLHPLRAADFATLPETPRTSAMQALASAEDATTPEQGLRAAQASVRGLSAQHSTCCALLLLHAAIDLRLEDDAIAAASAAVRADGNSANAHLLLGRAHLARYQVPLALKSAERCVSMEPGRPETHRLVAVCAGLLGDSGKAKRAWRIVLHLLPGDAEAQAGINRYE